MENGGSTHGRAELPLSIWHLVFQKLKYMEYAAICKQHILALQNTHPSMVVLIDSCSSISLEVTGVRV